MTRDRYVANRERRKIPMFCIHTYFIEKRKKKSKLPIALNAVTFCVTTAPSEKKNVWHRYHLCSPTVILNWDRLSKFSKPDAYLGCTRRYLRPVTAGN